jgi:hypothetical protein
MSDIQQVTIGKQHPTASKELPDFEIPENVLSQELNGEVVLLNMDNESYYSLNSVGSRIWQLLSQKMNIESITQELLKIYKVDESTLCQDVAMLIHELCENELLCNAKSRGE